MPEMHLRLSSFPSAITRPPEDPIALQPGLESLPENCMNTEGRGEKARRAIPAAPFELLETAVPKARIPPWALQLYKQINSSSSCSFFFGLKPIEFGLLSLPTES